MQMADMNARISRKASSSKRDEVVARQIKKVQVQCTLKPNEILGLISISCKRYL